MAGAALGALAAGILAVASIGMVEYSHRNQQQEIVASNQTQGSAAVRAFERAPITPQAAVPQTEMGKKTFGRLADIGGAQSCP